MTLVDDATVSLTRSGFTAEQAHHILYDDLGGRADDSTRLKVLRCKQCGDPFYATGQGGAKYCSRTCRQVAYVNRNPRVIT